MNFVLMREHVSLLRKALVADWAEERFLSRVVDEMAFNVSSLIEYFSAVIDHALVVQSEWNFVAVHF